LCFTPFIFWVNRKGKIVCSFNSIECSSFTGECNKNGAPQGSSLRRKCALGAEFGRILEVLEKFLATGKCFWFVKIQRESALVAALVDLCAMASRSGFFAVGYCFRLFA
jgi:hypothetical protein